MALVPEHKLPGLVHARYVAPGVAPGHGVDSSTEGRERQASGGVRAGPTAALCPSRLDLASVRPPLSRVLTQGWTLGPVGRHLVTREGPRAGGLGQELGRQDASMSGRGSA